MMKGLEAVVAPDGTSHAVVPLDLEREPYCPEVRVKKKGDEEDALTVGTMNARSVLVLLALLSWAPWADAQAPAKKGSATLSRTAARITLTPEREIVADGASTYVLKLRVDAKADIGVKAKVVASHGTVLAVGPVVGGSADVAYRPALSKKATRVRFRVSVTVGRKRATETLFIDVAPPSAEPAGASEGTSQPALPPLEDGVALRVLAQPGSLVLDKAEQNTAIYIDAPPGEKVEDVRLFANVGVITDARVQAEPSAGEGAVSSSRWRARYSPPGTFFPQVALVAAQARVNGEVVWAFTSIPLWGLGTVTVKARPGSKVELDLARRKYGPVWADRRGMARVPVEVPPGFDSARYKRQTLPVAVVPFSRVLALPEEPRVPQDGSRSTRIRVFAVDAKGAPLETPVDVRMVARAGVLGALETVAPGMFVAEYRPPKKGDGEAHVSAFIAGQEKLKSDAVMTMTSGAPAGIDLLVEPRRFSPGDKPMRVTVRVLDAIGATTSAGVLGVTTTLGSLATQVEIEPGVYQLELLAPDRFGGAETLEVLARVRAGDQVVEEVATVELRAGPVARVSVEAPKAAIAADGEDEQQLEVGFYDAFDNPAVESAAIAKAEHGAAGGVVATERPGRYRLSYSPPLSYDASLDTVEVRTAQGVVGSVALPLRPLRKQALFGVMAGGLSNGLGLHAPTLTLDFSYRFEGATEPLLQGLAIAAEISPFHRWSPGFLVGLEGHLTGVPVGVSARYHFRFLQDFTVYGGLGLQAALFNSVAVHDDHVGWELFLGGGAFGSVGATWRLGPGALVAEARVTGFATEPQVTYSSSFLAGGALLGGYRLELF